MIRCENDFSRRSRAASTICSVVELNPLSRAAITAPAVEASTVEVKPLNELQLQLLTICLSVDNFVSCFQSTLFGIDLSNFAPESREGGPCRHGECGKSSPTCLDFESERDKPLGT